MAKKEAYEYVFVKDHPTAVSDLKTSSEDVQIASNAASEVSNLEGQKNFEIEKALELSKTILEDISKIKKGMPIKQMAVKGQAAPRPRPAPVTTKAKIEEHKEFMARSQKALQHLHKNISELKQELGKIK